MKPKSTLITGFILLLFVGIWPLKSQANNPAEKEKITLLSAIEQISQEYDVYFTFDMTLVSEVKVEYEHKEYATAEEAVSAILRGTDLKYKFYDQRFVILYKKGEEGLESLKKMSEHLDGLIGEEEKTISSILEREIRAVPKLSSKLLSREIQRIAFTVEGKVVDQDGESLIGVNIQVKGSNKGTATDFDGNFILEDIDENDILVISYVGYQTQEISVAGKSIVNIIMHSGAQQLSELVITAMGLSKGKGSLVSAITEVDGSEFTVVRENNVANALTGKVAGVNVSGMSTGPGGSSRVVIRGNGSLNGDNQPLYVINGMPMNNTSRQATTGEGSTTFDRGDGIASINPDDIETMTVLKGGAAAALYGSQAANGVILITTKQGKVQDGIGVELNTNFTMGSPLVYPDFQYEYGQGIGGAKPQTREEAIASGRLSFGEKMDGKPYIQFDGQMRPYSPVNVKENWKNFYRPATNLTNSLAFSGGSSSSLIYRLSLSDLRATALEPKSSYSRQTANLNIRSELGENSKFIIEANMQYNYDLGKNRPGNGYADNSTNWALNLLANTVDIRDLSPGYDENNNEIQWQQVPEAQNPYFVINRMGNNDNKHRFIGQGSIQYNIRNNLYIKINGMRDLNRFQSMDYMPVGTAKRPRGIFNSGHSFDIKSSGQTLINYSKNILNDFDISIMGGGEIQRSTFESQTNNGSEFIDPELISYNNLSIQSNRVAYEASGQNSLFGTIDLDYKKMVYLSITGRNDWFSVLAYGKNSIFYPSIGTSIILSEIFKMSGAFEYLKLRGSWAKVGSATVLPYEINRLYDFMEGGFGGKPVQIPKTNRIANTDLQPLTSTTYEVGFDADFIGGRFGVDLTFYSRKTIDDILNVPFALSSGYNSGFLNVGSLSNKGVELLLSGKPISGKEFVWRSSFNFSYNKNEILKLAEGVDNVGGAEVGDPFNTIQANSYVYNEKGERIYDKKSGYEIFALQKAGTGVPPYIAGINNNFHYKNFSLEFLIDGKFGNIVQSGLSRYMYRFGLSKLTLPGRENGLEVSGVDEEGQPFSKTWPVEQLNAYYNREASISPIGTSIFDGSFIKLRHIILSYSIPKKTVGIPWIQNVVISLISRNTALLYSKITDFDPESTYKVGNDQANTSNTIPSTRDFGINLKIKF